jgi:predicted CXXCH cytochrome family protein
MALVLAAGDPPANAPVATPNQATYVTSAKCVSCHAEQGDLWRGSHHDLAMQEVSKSSVLGDFSGTSLEHFGVTTTFERKDDRWVVRTDGRDGQLAEFDVAYTFGVEPLQQLLLPMPGGRLQALQVAWNSRPAGEHGQRWFHLYPDEPIPSGDDLHWTGRRFNWNSACAECHSTALRRNYDEARDAYATSFAEIDVACEACHGPGSGHLAWVLAQLEDEAPEDPTKGFGVAVVDHSGGEWVMDPVRGIALRTVSPSPDVQLDLCGRCHSRRWQMSEDYAPDAPLLDTHLPSLLEDSLYWPDGQIRDEVYEWGSFLQSRMHANGVRCTDCHDPHSLRLRAEGNALCIRCHQESVYDTPGHHHHPGGQAACVDCHMPQHTYMQVDGRRDHSFRVPRPDLTQKLGVPSACDDCHKDRGAPWAAERIAEWLPQSGQHGKPHFADALVAARTGSPQAPRLLAECIADTKQPAIVRATALAAFAQSPGTEGLELAAAGLNDRDGLVRLAGLQALENQAPVERAKLVVPLLTDPLRSVRAGAARLLSGVPDSALPEAARKPRARALEEWLAAERLNADTPEAHLNLGLMALARGELELAESEYRTALRLDRAFVPAAVNLADLLRERSKEDDALQVLIEALRVAPRQAALHHALGLALVRAGRREEALASLGRAVDLAPGDARFAYVLAVALQDAGSRDLALRVLERGLQANPNDLDLLVAHALALREAGRIDEARAAARRLAADRPGDPTANALLRELEGNAPNR